MSNSDSTLFYADELSPELTALLDAAVAGLSATRRTFTEREAFAAIWEAGYDISPQIDPRFALAAEADGIHPRHWRLTAHAVANNLLADAFTTGAWDGRDLEAELVRLSEADSIHYVFCPIDRRFTQHRDGTWDLAARDVDVELPQATREELDAIGPRLRERWASAGAGPWTLRLVADELAALGWSGASERGSWMLVRAWLCGWPAVVRVGQDYWTLADRVPQAPSQRRLRVIPVLPTVEEDITSSPSPSDEGSSSTSSDTRHAPPPSIRTDALDPPSDNTLRIVAAWTMALRTVHLVDGFIPVPAAARKAYPARAAGMATWEVIRGKWYDTGDDIWLWLDRDHNRLCGPDLADQLAWCEAGQRMRLEWTPEVIILRLLDVDPEVQREEGRLVDLETLAELRGGLAESYRRSLQIILSEASDGLTFADVVEALRARQGHDVHRGTVRALLSSGGFVRRDGRWFTAPDDVEGARRLRRVLVQTLMRPEPTSASPDPAIGASPAAMIGALRTRLTEIIAELGSTKTGTDEDDSVP